MPFTSGRDLKQDILFRASESISGASGWDAKAMDYLNRAYKALASGGSEFLPEYIEDWWWLRARGVLTLLPPYDTGSISLVSGSASATLTDAPAFSLVGFRLRVLNASDLYLVSAHTAAATAVTLDSVFTGETGTYNFRAMKVSYALDAAVVSLISPMTSFRTSQIIGMTPERMDQLYPLARLKPGVPSAFSLDSEQSVRFNAGGLENGESMRIEYLYRPSVVELTDSLSSIPLVPAHYRHLLSDMALSYVATDKNDDRAVGYAGTAKAGLVAMVRENRRRLSKMDTMVGTIRPRQNDRWPGGTIIRDPDAGVIVQ